MKLFQQMLVAGATLSLLAPIAAQASDIVNIEEMNSYARSKKKKSPKFDNKTFSNDISDVVNLEGADSSLEGQKRFEAGTFSDTTVMGGVAVMWIGSIDGADEITGTATDEGTSTGYTYKWDCCLCSIAPDSVDSAIAVPAK